MSTTANDIFKLALALIDELTPIGGIDAGKTADYAGKAPSLIDLIQGELLKAGDFYNVYELSLSPAPNMLGNSTGFDIKEYTANADLTMECINPTGYAVKAYNFETDSNSGTAYIEDFTSTWNVLATINMVNSGAGFIPYKGAVTPTAGATKSRIRFTGSNFYRTVNRALFQYSYEAGKEPIYMPWVKIALPTAVKSIDQVITEYPDRQYSKDNLYKIEKVGNRQYLYVNYNFNGKLRVQYIPVPSPITSLASTMQIDDVTSRIVAYKLASMFMIAEQNLEVADRLLREFKELKAEANIKQPMGITDIIDFYGTFGGV